MQATYRPPARAPAHWLDAKAAEAPVPVPFLDEDEATMAVAAVEAVLRRARLAAAQVRRIAVSSRTGSGFAPTLAAALGVPPERVEEGAAILYGQTHVGTPGEGPVLHVQSDAPRPGRVPAEGVGAGAFATARLSGPGMGEAGDGEVPVRAFTPERDVVDRLGQWERDSTRRTTMGAYVPSGTWQRSLGARYRLEGAQCPGGHVEYPPRPLCGQCGRPTSPAPLPRPGVVETYTVVAKGAGPSEYDPWQSVAGEYAVVVARFGAARVPGLWADAPAEAPRIGARVEPVFRRLFGQDGEWRYGLKLRPA
jgi:scaffold protein (connect acetoacetyl-CoA thiolase and HMG-CoA synthase)